MSNIRKLYDKLSSSELYLLNEIEKLKNLSYPKLNFDNHSAKLVEKLSGSSTLKLQKEFSSALKVQYALSGLNGKNHFQSILRSLSPTAQILNILNKYKSDMEFVGHYKLATSNRVTAQHSFIYDIGDNTEMVNADESQLAVPEEIKKRLIVVENLPQKTIQKIINKPEYMRQIDSRDFELFVAHLIEELGFDNVVVTPRSGDGGRDILATKNVHGVPLLFAFECKQYKSENKIQLDTLRSLLGSVSHGKTKSNIGVLVTTSYFTQGGKDFILSEASIDGKDFDDIVNWINEIKVRH